MTTAPRTAEAMLDDIACRYGAGEPGIGRLELHRAALDFAREHAEAERARHRDAAKTSAPTLPPEIEAAIESHGDALYNRGFAHRAKDEPDEAEYDDADGRLRTAITSALAAAREAGRREVLEGAAGVEEAIEAVAHSAQQTGRSLAKDEDAGRCPSSAPWVATLKRMDALRAAIAADKARAVEEATAGMRPFDPELAARIRQVAPFDCVSTTGDGKATLRPLGAGAPNAVCSSPQVAYVLQDAIFAALTGAGGGR